MSDAGPACKVMLFCTHCSGGGQKMTGSLESGFLVVFVSLLGFFLVFFN